MNPDVNGDDSTDITDITCLIERLLGTSSDGSYSYDVNNDEFVDITDITTLISIILGL